MTEHHAPTPSAEANAIIDEVVAGLQQILATNLLGVYLYGSAVTGDFDPVLSDIDLLAVLAADVDNGAFDALLALHNRIACAYPGWQDRVETHYLTTKVLHEFRTVQHQMIVISPGEPLHRLPVRRDYLVNWYVVREQGTTLYGPDPRTIMPPIAQAEFVAVVRDHLRQWPEWIREFEPRRPALAYAVVTVCRALYSIETGEQTSKRRAALWVRDRMPQWSALIDDALRWRDDWRAQNDVHDPAAFAATTAFVDEAAFGDREHA